MVVHGRLGTTPRAIRWFPAMLVARRRLNIAFVLPVVDEWWVRGAHWYPIFVHVRGCFIRAPPAAAIDSTVPKVAGFVPVLRVSSCIGPAAASAVGHSIG
jgi:hypothetical protein